MYTTPLGTFQTLQEVSDAHGISRQTAHTRFKSPGKFADWTSTITVKKPGPARPVKIKRVKPVNPLPSRDNVKLALLSDHGLSIRLGKLKNCRRVRTPAGIFACMLDAARAHGTAEGTIRYRIKIGVAGYSYVDV